MLPQILTPPAFGTPVAALSIDGLGICCFNHEKTEWEVAFPRTLGHDLKMLVKQVDRLGRIRRQSKPVDIGTNIRHIEIHIDDGSDAHLATFPDGFFKAATHFSRRGDESFDFRWVIDVAGPEVPHGPFFGVKQPHPPVTLVTIPHSLFYTKRVTAEAVILGPHTCNPDLDGLVLGRTNEEIGAAIYSAPKAEELKIRDKATLKPILENFLMPVEPGLTYEVSLLNMESSPFDEGLDIPVASPPAILPSETYFPGDFQSIYEVLNFRGTKHEVFAPLDSVFRAVDGDCHTHGGGHDGGNIASLAGLIL